MKQLVFIKEQPLFFCLQDSSPIHNLANTKHQQRASSQHSGSASHAATQHDSDTNETVALLETQTRNKINIISSASGEAGVERKAQVHTQRPQLPTCISLSLPPASHSLSASSLGNGTGTGTATTAGAGGSGDVESSLGLSGGQLPRRRRFGNFLKSLVGLKASSGSSSTRASERERERDRDSRRESTNQRPASPEIRITRTPSEQDVVLRDPSGQQLTNGHGSRLSINGSSNSLNVVQQKLRHMMRREGSASSLHQEKSQSIVTYTGLRKCETVLALTHQSHTLHPMAAGMGDAASHGGSGIFSAGGVEQIRPLNRLRNSVTSINGATCSRCSSLLSLAATGSRYSLANGFVPRPDSALSLSTSHQRRPSVSFVDGPAAATMEPTSEPMPEPHINVNAQIRLSNGSSCGSRKSSSGLHSASSPSPPSNVTTATLHSNNNNSSNNSNNNNNNGVTIEEPEEQQPLATPNSNGNSANGEHGPFGTTNAYPLTVSSLLSMASANQSAQACCVRDGITLPTAGTPATPINFQQFTCKLCLIDVDSVAEATTLQQCGCQFCTEVSTINFKWLILKFRYR